MPETYLILDANNVAARAFHAMGEALTHGQMFTGTVYGFMATTLSLMEKLGTTNVIFCFDQGRPKRLNVLPTYKETRKKAFALKTKKEQRQIEVFRKQVAELRDGHLPAAGFRNVFTAQGYEADDVIARVVRDLPPGSESVIVSGDEDLYQLLEWPRTMIWKQHKSAMFSRKDFEKEYDIEPRFWRHVKAIAGCSTDDVPGIRGVGEKKAIAFLMERMTKYTPTYDRIVEFLKSDDYRINMKLVGLPYRGCPKFEIRPDVVSPATWHEFCDRFGIKKLRDQHPACSRRVTFGLRRK